MRTFGRRFISIGLVFILLPLLVILSPVLFTGSILFDLVGGRRDLPTARLGLFAIVFLIHEWIVVPYGLWLWVRGGFGTRLDLGRHSHVQGVWTGSLLRWTGRLLGVEIDWPDELAMPDESVIVISRHASMVDAILPAHLFPAILGRPVHYVLKRELRWLPSIDIYGGRLGNHFVQRGGNLESEVAAIGRLADQAEPGAGLVIFPEGTYATTTSRRRVRESLARKGDDGLLAYSDQLRELLPPKPAGTLALLNHRPDAPVVIFGHEGMEGVAEFSGLRKYLPADHPVRVTWWVHTDVPRDDSAVGWLQARWLELDRWVADRRAHRAQS